MLPDTAAQNPDHPWDRRLRATPLQTWSGRVVYQKKKSVWTTKDANRILNALVPPASDIESDWVRGVIKMLRAASLRMLGLILFWVPSDIIDEIYQWSIEILNRFFDIQDNQDYKKSYAKGLILYISNRAGVDIEFL